MARVTSSVRHGPDSRPTLNEPHCPPSGARMSIICPQTALGLPRGNIAYDVPDRTMAMLVLGRLVSHCGAGFAKLAPSATVTSHCDVVYGRPAASFCWSTRRTATPLSSSGAVSNQVFAPGAKLSRRVNAPFEPPLTALSHSARMSPELPFEITIEFPAASVPSPTTVPFDARSLHQRILRSWFRKQA